MHNCYLQHLLVFSLVLSHRDAADIMVELLIKCTAEEPVSNHSINRRVEVPRNSKTGGILLPDDLLLVLHRLFSLLYQLLPIAADIGISVNI